LELRRRANTANTARIASREGWLLPGIIGIVGRGVDHARLRAGLDALMHFDTYGACELAVGERTVLGQVWRDGDQSSTDWHVDRASGAAALIAGYALTTSGDAKRVHARSVLERHLRGGTFDPRDVDGSFVVVIADPRARLVLVSNDRLGTLPLYYSTSQEGSVAFAPEAKALFAGAGVAPKLSKFGVVSFLNCGYCLGKATLFENVEYLEPGSTMVVAMDTAAIEVRRYWKIVYSAAPELKTRRAAEAALYDATRSAHARIVADSIRGHDLLLSGGWDSRGILAFLDTIRRPPRKAVAWGSTRVVPLSDPSLAEKT
jgi:asparagine synthetase B (glutamine-hydrolysing)